MVRAKTRLIQQVRSACELKIADRRGKKKAAVALARKLARILFAMWRDGSEFDADKTNAPVATLVSEREAEAPTS